MRNFILAYCSENRSVVQEMDRQLSQAGLEFKHISCDDQSQGEFLSAKINAEAGQEVVLLFISDNFLRSSQCMYKALLMLKNLSESNRLLTVITDGQHTDPLTKKVSSTPTSFERVSNVIQYMNHWQEQYLAMRKQKRNITPEQEDAFEGKLKLVRSISTEIGEFLRYLRSQDHVQYEELKQNQYELFFNATGNMGLYLDFKKKQPLPTAPVEAPTPVVEETPPPAVEETPPSISEAPPATIETPAVTTEVPATPPEVPVPPIVEEAAPEPVVTATPEKVEAPPAVKEPEIEEEDVEELEIDEIPIDDLITAPVIEEETPPVEMVEPPQNNPEPVVAPPSPQAVTESTPVVEEEKVEKPQESSYELLQSLFEEDDEEEESDENELESTAAIVQHAQILIEGGKVEEGLAFLGDRIKEQANNAELRYKYAEMLVVHKNDYAVATNHLETSLQHNAKHIPSHLLLAEIAESQKDIPTSIQHYSNVYDIYPTIPGLAYKLGSLKVNNEDEDVKTSAALFKEALKLDPLNVDARYQYAILLYESLDKPAKAIRHLEETLRLQPDHDFANYDLALIYHSQGDFDKAASYYQKAGEANPELKTPANDRAFRIASSVVKAEELTAPPVEETLLKTPVNPIVTPKAVPVEPQQADTPVVLITGATAGIGRATATLFAEKGFRLILTGRRNEKLEALQKDFKTQYGIDCHLLNFDVRNAQAAQQALNSLPQALKEIDILINNAGLAKGFAPIHEGKLEDWETMIDTNVKGLLYLTRAVSPQMVKRQKGHIINVCSSAGHEVYPNGNVYCATKYAVDALTKSMRLDLHKHNIRVSQVSPGHVEETEFAMVRFDGNQERAKIYEDFNPLKSRDVAEVIWFIATRPAYVTIQDVQMMGTQQASSNHIHRNGRQD